MPNIILKKDTSIHPLENIDIQLPRSKSISNRVLIIQALSTQKFNIKNLSDSDDTLLLQKALKSRKKEINVGHAGTTMRFLTAFFATRRQTITLRGSERMHQRPIEILVEALNKLGAKITFLEKQGYPPLQIKRGHFTQKNIQVSGNISSQYISALLMIAPTLPQGLEIQLEGRIVSIPYINMTLEIMKYFGIQFSWSENTIIIPPQKYKPRDFDVEADWSAASYWYSLLLMSHQKQFRLHGLSPESLQGDAKVLSFYKDFGIESSWNDNNVLTISRTNVNPNPIVYDFSETPDLAQTLVVSCILKGVPFHFKGLETLKIKETNRIDALITESKKLGIFLYEPQQGQLYWDGKRNQADNTIQIATYNDHRMAMAYAPVALTRSIGIEKSEVVSKSYPNFWTDLNQLNLFAESIENEN